MSRSQTSGRSSGMAAGQGIAGPVHVATGAHDSADPLAGRGVRAGAATLAVARWRHHANAASAERIVQVPPGAPGR